MRFHGLAALCGLLLAASLPAQTPAGEARALADEVQILLAERCERCHGAALQKPKGGFGNIEDLKRLVADGYVNPGKPLDSDLFLILDDPDAPMPPRDAEEPRLDHRERALLHYWIASGAPEPGAPLPTARGAAEPVVIAPEITPKEAGFWLRLGGSLHVVLVHTPVCLLLLAIVIEFLSSGRHPRVRTALVRFCLGFGSLFALASAGSGWIAVHTEGYRPDSVELHRWTGIAAAGLGLLLFFAHELVARQEQCNRWPLRVGLLVLALLVAFTGHLGGELVHGEGHIPFGH